MTATAIERPVVPTEIPGPTGDPLLGMARPLRRDPLGTMLDGFARYGDVVAYRVGPARGPARLRRRVVAVHAPDDVRRVLTDMGTFTRDTPSYRVLHELFGSNLVTANGPTWRRQKRTLQPLFTRRAVAQYTELIEGEARKAIESAPPDAGGAVDVAHEMERYALRVLGHTLFKEAEGIDDDTIAALERLVPVVGRRVRSRSAQAVRLPLGLPTLRNRRFVTTREALHATVDRVRTRRAAREAAGGAREVDDLLRRLHDARDPEDGEPLADAEVRDQALMFLFAGHTTTSNALTSTLHLLGRHPEIQEQVAQAAASQDTDLERPDLVRACVQEALRLYPPAYALARRTAGDTEVGGHPIPAGTLVLVSPWVTHRHPEWWDEPERFDPWRFMGGDRRARQAWFPFGGGARSCIGRHLALLEASILVRALLREHRLESLDAAVPLDTLISMRPAGPVRVRWHAR
jgi:cytochrome P450